MSELNKRGDSADSPFVEQLKKRYGMDFHKLKEEKINGKIYLMARPSKPHARIQRNITNIFNDYFRQKNKKCEPLPEIRLDLDNGDYVEPDVMVFCYENEREDKEEVPLIVIEVLSKSSRKKDLGIKMEKYAWLGIREYWVIDQYSSILDVYVLDNGRYKLTITCGIDNSLEEETEIKDLVPEFVSAIFPDLIIKAEEVFYSVI